MRTKMPKEISQNLASWVVASWVCGELGGDELVGGELGGGELAGVEMSVYGFYILASVSGYMPRTCRVRATHYNAVF